MHCIPAILHPTTIALVDDDQNLLDALSLMLSDQYKLKTFPFAKAAKKALLKHKKSAVTPKKYYTEGEGSFENYSISIQFKAFLEVLLNSKRFTNVCILIVDFDMPDLNGLELAKILKAKMPIKVIMLTGVADLDTAINAFNQKEIDRFVLKSDPNHPQILQEYIQQLQQEYFSEHYQAVADALNKDGKHPLCDTAFIAAFQSICNKHQIVEYYLLNESGSFLMLDAQGQQTYLIVNTATDLETYSELAEDDEQASRELKNKLQNHSHVVFVPNMTDFTPYVNAWQLFEATQIKNKPIFYAVIPHNAIKINLDFSKIMTFYDFLMGPM
ncbi:MAG: response regulator [Gammaproteobacteria bacterium]